MEPTLSSTQQSLKEVSKNIDNSFKGAFSKKVVETLDTKSKEYSTALK